MFNRRFLRIKVMQALYSFFKDEKADIRVAEKNVFTSIDKSYELFLYLLRFLNDLQFVARIAAEEARAKRLPTQEDLTPNLKFINNLFLQALNENKAIQSLWNTHKISWQNDQDLVRKVFTEWRNTESYKKYMSTPETNFQEDKKCIQSFLADFLYEHELFNFWFEEKNIYWSDDYYFGFLFLNKWIDGVSDNKMPTPKLYREEAEDKKFVSELFLKTIRNVSEYDTLIDANTKNWELDRIASLDVLLMKMTLTELLYISSVPVKVSMNEYIDIAKEYSSPQSGGFINGVLDRLVIQLKAENKIQKTGRGLLEG
ncbi:MAG: transcription antitermination factor NusB [Bacteroidetes bacterium]|nr:transcription antitermination factor NusB [Bacteroidota bacterium]